MDYVDSDVVVIGAGIVGSFTALRLAQKGCSVCLVEKGALFREASGRNGGGVRQQFRDPAEIPLAMEAVKIWADLAEELGQDLEYRRKGSLRLIRSQEDLEFAEKRVLREKAMGLEVDLLKPRQVRKLVPCLADDMNLLGATFCQSDGTANPLLVGKALGAVLKACGVNVCLHEKVRNFIVKNGRVKAALTDKTQYRAKTFVNAAGPWAQKLCQSLGIEFPIIIRKSQLLVTEPVSPIIPGFISFDNGYIRQAADGNLHLGVRGEPLEHIEKDLTFQALVYAGQTFPEVFPFMRNIHILRGFTGITTWTLDGIPIIDKISGLEGMYLATGFSGHGFCLGPVVGKLLAEWIVQGKSSLDLSAFALNRFIPKK